MILNGKNKEYKYLSLFTYIYIYTFLKKYITYKKIKKIYRNFKCIKTNLINKSKFSLIIIIT